MRSRYLYTVVSVTFVSFVSMYVAATMNAIGDNYQVGLDSFKLPFYITNLFILFSCALWILISAVSSRLRNRSKKYLAGLGYSILLATTLVFSLGFAPCLKPHPTTEDYSTHHNLKEVIERSLLCPRYSGRSYPGIFIYALLGVTLLGMSRWGTEKNA